MFIGQPAPVFTAPAVLDGNKSTDQFSLESLLGKKLIVLFFYPKDFTFVCPTELLELQKHLPDFQARNVSLLACSTDTLETHAAWLRTPPEKGGIKGVQFPLIADESKTIASNYGVLGGHWGYDEQDRLTFEGAPIAYRATFFIDLEGIIRYKSLYDLSLGRNINEILRVVDMWIHTQKHGVVCPAGWQQGDQGFQASQKGVRSFLQETYTSASAPNQEEAQPQAKD